MDMSTRPNGHNANEMPVRLAYLVDDWSGDKHHAKLRTAKVTFVLRLLLKSETTDLLLEVVNGIVEIN